MFYTYLHCKPNGDPFYVGKGVGNRYRVLNRPRNKHHFNIVQKYGIDNIKVFVFECGSEDEAKTDEIIQIAQLRREGYSLANKSDGGEGTSGFRHSAESKVLMGLKNKGRKPSPRMMAMLIGNTRGKGWVPTEEQRRKIAAAGIGSKRRVGKKHTEESKRKISETKKGRPSPLKGRKLSDEQKQQRALTQARRIDGETNE